MYIYNYIHIWRAARNVKNPPTTMLQGPIPSVEDNKTVQTQSGLVRPIGHSQN